MGAAQMQLLGSATARNGAKTVVFASNLRFLALAYLAYSGSWVAREDLAFLFWPDTLTGTARHNLRQLLKHLRKLDWLTDLESTSTHIRWAVPTDVAEFRRSLAAECWQDAVRQYPGPLLQGLHPPEQSEFADWLEHERVHLHGQWREAIWRHCDELQRQGQHQAAAARFNALLEQDGLDEDAVRACMNALFQAGQRGKAIRVYREFASHLGDTLGMTPSSETEQLFHSLEAAPVRVQARPASPAEPGPVSGRGATHGSSFLGRDLELAHLAHLLSDPHCRLLTLIGPGGVGKSRIAWQAADELGPSYPDGTATVQLEALTSPESIAGAVAGALGIALTEQNEATTQLARHIDDKRMLLVLDNFEHLTGGSPHVDRILRACPNLDAVVTSRERLRLDGEWLLPIEGFPVPRIDSVSLDDAREYDALRLFTERARRLRPDFTILEPDLPHLLEICRLVGGLPLGIELAAAWVRFIPVDEIAVEIERSLDFLQATDRRADSRHQGIRAVFERSWSRLSSEEQEVLTGLSVFRGGFDRPAASVVAGATISSLVGLIDKSLLRARGDGRYDFHPLLHGYAADKLSEVPGRRSRVGARHARYYLSLAEKAKPELSGARQQAWLERLESEHDNFREALSWALESGEAGLGLRLAAALWWFWWVRGHLAEGRRRLGALLSSGADSQASVRTAARRGAGVLAFAQGDYDSARELLEESLAGARRAKDERGVISSMNFLGMLAGQQGEFERARSLFEACLKEQRNLGNSRSVAAALNNLGLVARSQGEIVEAAALYEEAVAIARELQDIRSLAAGLHNLATLREQQRDLASARSLHEESLLISRALEDRQGVARSLNNLGVVAMKQGRLAEAGSLIEESLTIKRELGDRQGTANSLSKLAKVRESRGEPASARALYRESMLLMRQLHDRNGTAMLLEEFAALAAAAGQSQRAVRLMGAAAAARATLGSRTGPQRTAELDTSVHELRLELGVEEFGTAWAEGEAMGLDSAASYALQAL